MGGGRGGGRAERPPKPPPQDQERRPSPQPGPPVHLSGPSKPLPGAPRGTKAPRRGARVGADLRVPQWRPPKHLLSSQNGAPAPPRASMLTPLCLRNFPKRGGAQKPGSKLGPTLRGAGVGAVYGVVPSSVRVVPRGAMGVGSSDYSTSPGGIEPGLRASRAVVVPLCWLVAQQIESLLSCHHALDESTKLVLS